METIEIVKLVLGIFSLGYITETMVEYLFGQAVNHIKQLDPFRWLLMYVAAAVGVGLAYFYQLDLIALVFEGYPTWVGMLITGLSIGRGANYLHQFVSTYLQGHNPWG